MVIRIRKLLHRRSKKHLSDMLKQALPYLNWCAGNYGTIPDESRIVVRKLISSIKEVIGKDSKDIEQPSEPQESV